MITSRLPLDLWLEVFPYLCADIPTLRNLSLACLFLRNMSIPHLFRSLAFPFPSGLRRAFRLLHSTYIHPYVESMNLTARLSKLDVMKSGSSLRVLMLTLIKMEHLRRLAIDFPCPVELYEYIRDSKTLKQLLWTTIASKLNRQGRPRCRLEAIEFADMKKKGSVPAGLIIESALTLKSLSVHSSWYIYTIWAFAQATPFSNLTSFTFSSTDEDIAPHALQDILESCPSITTLRLSTPLAYPFSISPDALPRLKTFNVGPNAFLLRFLEGRPVRRLFANLIDHLSLPSELQHLQNCSFSLLHVEIDYSYAEEFINEVNRTLIYCEDLALTVWIDGRTVRLFLTFTLSISHLTPIQPSDVAVTTLVTWLTAPSLVDLTLTIRTRGNYVEEVLNMVELRCHFEIRLRDACGGSPNLQQLTVEYCLSVHTEHGFHARRLSKGEWVVRSLFGGNTSMSWYHAETELAETELAETEEV